MLLQRGLVNLATLSLVGFMSVACNSGSTTDRYAEGLEEGKKQGYQTGYDDGYTDGYTDGDTAGFERARLYFASADYNSGFADGKVVGIEQGYAQGYTVGKTDGVNIGYNSGYNDGYSDGDADGYNAGYNDGYDDGSYEVNSGAYTAGYNDGYDDGSYDGYNIGYDDGMYDGYDIGYDDGWYDGYGLSVGKSKGLRGYANLLSMVHNDLFDYSKIKAPAQTKRGLVANGRLILSETSTTNKDTLKRAAAVEQYLVVEMAKQVKGKFGLSAERSLKVAKAANHFRKFSTNRALTAEDTNAYASEIIGTDFSQITKAYEAGMKGDLSAFNSVMEKAAEKNETSPEKMAGIVTSFFM